MSQTPQQPSDEIDLRVIFDKLKSFFKSALKGIIMIFRFFWNHKIRLIILLLIGFSVQLLLLTKTEKIYNNEFLVKTNFGSTEYLYGKVQSVNAKIESNDSLFLKNVFGPDYDRVEELVVVPVTDVYNLVNKSEENNKLFKILIEEYDDFTSFTFSDINIREYPVHKIRIYIKGLKSNKEISDKSFAYLSDNSYYNEIKRIALDSYKQQLIQNEIIRSQIDSIVISQKNSQALPQFDNNSINFTGSQDIKELLSQKKGLLDDDKKLKNKISTNDEVIKTINSSYGILSEEYNSNYFAITYIIVGAYCLFFFFKFLNKNISRFE